MSENKITGGIYRITLKTDGRTYVGQSKNIQRRLTTHRRQLNTCCHINQGLQLAWCEFGESQFEIAIIELIEPGQDLSIAENKWMSFYDSVNNGFNACYCGTTHGKSEGDKTYNSWRGMVDRARQFPVGHCEIDPRWATFSVFLADMGEKPTQESILTKIDNSLPFSKTNCYWGTRGDSVRNNKRTVYIEWNDRVQCMQDWATETGIDRTLIDWRLQHGWSVDDALSTPVIKQKRLGVISWQGETMTVSQWEKRLGMKPRCLQKRLTNGWDIERAFTTPPQEEREIEWQGEVKTIREWANHLNIDYGVLKSRFKHGWDADRAFTEKPRYSRNAKPL